MSGNLTKTCQKIFKKSYYIYIFITKIVLYDANNYFFTFLTTMDNG